MRAGSRELPGEAAAFALSACAVLRPALPLLRLQHLGRPTRIVASRLRRAADARDRPRRTSDRAAGGGIPCALGRRHADLAARRLPDRHHGPAEGALRIRHRTPRSRSNSTRPRCRQTGARRSVPWASRASASACRISSLRCSSAIGRLQSYEETKDCADAARSARGRFAQSRSHLRPCRCRRRRGSRARRDARSI